MTAALCATQGCNIQLQYYIWQRHTCHCNCHSLPYAVQVLQSGKTELARQENKKVTLNAKDVAQWRHCAKIRSQAGVFCYIRVSSVTFCYIRVSSVTFCYIRSPSETFRWKRLHSVTVCFIIGVLSVNIGSHYSDL